MINSVEQMLQSGFGTVPDLIRLHARHRPDHVALIQEDRRMTYAELDNMMDRVAAGLQRDGVRQRSALSVCATASIEYACLFLGGLRAGVAVAPLAPSSTPGQLVSMIADCGASLFFLDQGVAAAMSEVMSQVTAVRITLDGSDHGQSFNGWLPGAGSTPNDVVIEPTDPFNIIYSSGTTGTPKGIVQSHAMRWRHLGPREDGIGYDPEAISLLSTPLYSNTTLVCFFPTLAGGGTVALMGKFDVRTYLETAERIGMTHTMLVPVQYRRLMEYPEFDRFDLSKTVMRFCTSAPFSAELKAEVLRRWPGGLTEYYGMTEGGGGFVLFAHLHPDKLHTVGQPGVGSIIKLIDEDGKEVGPNQIGEIVGRSPSTMSGYHNQPGKTAEAQWTDPESGDVYIRTGDVGKLDEEGFLTLMDRRKDMIISGGFNIYPSDMEAVIQKHPDVAEAAVVGVASKAWGETPVAFVALKAGSALAADVLKDWTNSQVGKTQRLSDLRFLDALPRSHIGKVLKRELRDEYGAFD